MEISVYLFLIGILALTGELFLPSGIIGIIGVGFIVASILLFYGFSFNISIFGGLVVSAILGVVFLLYVKHMKKIPAKTGAESLIGLNAKVVSNFSDGKGIVEVKSEKWSCRSLSGKNYKKGTSVVIKSFQGVFLEVD